MKVYMEQDTRFWSIETKGKKCTINYGKIGCAGRTMDKSFDSKKECSEEVNDMIRKKKDKGYSEATKKRKKMDVSDDESLSDQSVEPPAKKRKTTRGRKKKEESSSDSESASDDSQDIKNEETLRDLLKESAVLLMNDDETREFSVEIDGKSYSFNERKAGRKGRAKSKKFSSKKKAFEAAIQSLKSKMRKNWSIVEEEEEEEEESSESDVAMEDETKKKSYKTIKMKGSAPIDEHCPYQNGYSVLEECGSIYDAMLNQTNIGNNNNKYYKLQVIVSDDGDEHYIHFRWGRVGYRGQQKTAPGTKEKCIADFKKKFYDKTLNDWEDRDDFEAHARKYTYLKMDYSTAKNGRFDICSVWIIGGRFTNHFRISNSI